MTARSDSRLLQPLTPEQQWLIDLVADAFVNSDFEWPLYDYVEGMHDNRRADAWAVLQSFPQVGRWGYSAVRWIRGGPSMPPTSETEIALTVVGMHHSESLCPYIPTYFALLDYLANARRAAVPTPRNVRRATASSTDFEAFWRESHRATFPDNRLTYQLLEGEPPGLYGSRSYDDQSRNWNREIPREALDFMGIETIDEYLRRLDRWLVEPESASGQLSESLVPLPLALDHLDDVWQLAFGERLFQLRGVERIASLANDVSTREDGEGRLSVLSDLLRTAARSQPPVDGRLRNRPLVALAARVFDRLGVEHDPRIEAAIDTLECVIALRDSQQHTGASTRSLTASTRLGVPYPLVDWPLAWQLVTARTVQALSVLREEIRATLE